MAVSGLSTLASIDPPLNNIRTLHELSRFIFQSHFSLFRPQIVKVSRKMRTQQGREVDTRQLTTSVL